MIIWEWRRSTCQFLHDAQYTAEEYPSKVGWGHTAAEMAVDFAAAAEAARLALFHHDPARDDRALSSLEHACRVRAANAGGIGSLLEVFAATEGQVVELAEREAVLTVPSLHAGGTIAAVDSAVDSVTDRLIALPLTSPAEPSVGMGSA